MAAFSLAIVAFQVQRYRQATSAAAGGGEEQHLLLRQRLQLRWMLLGLVAIAVTLPLALLVGRNASSSAASTITSTALYSLSVLVCMFALWIALVRYRLFNVDPVLNRALVYAGLTAGVVGIHALAVGLADLLLQHRDERRIVGSLIAAGVVAIGVQPLRARLQRGVNRLLYGERDDPYAVLTHLGQRLEATLAPDAVLPTLVATVRETLNLPYAAVALGTAQHSADNPIRAADGVPHGAPLALPLTYQGSLVGQLLVTPRVGETSLGTDDRRVLNDLTRHAGVAVHALQLTDALQRAREALVTTREEERRRLRRDMHDGLGPALATMTLQSDTARELVRNDPEAAEALLRELTAQTQETLADVRRLIHALRPPVLDDLGLSAALQALARPLRTRMDMRNPGAGSGTQITISTPSSLPPLPAAVEVAAYRIAQEALTNVLRHAHAHACWVTLTLDADEEEQPAVARGLRLQIADDGRGLGPQRTAGVGLTSLRERVEELGGRCSISSRPGGGTLVEAWLPVRAAPLATQPSQEV